jgi:hypothetical protein
VHGLGQACAGESFDRQVCHRDGLAFADQFDGELVVKLAPCIGHPCVSAGDAKPGLVPVGAAFLLAKEGALSLLELLLGPA